MSVTHYHQLCAVKYELWTPRTIVIGLLNSFFNLNLFYITESYRI